MDRSASLRAFCLFGFILASKAWGGAAVQLSAGVNGGEFSITPDGSRIVFQSYNGSANLLYSARTDGTGSPIPISPAGGSAYLFNGKFTPDSSSFIFNNHALGANGYHVATYSSRLDGSGAPVLLNDSRVYDDDPSQYNLAISPNSQTVVIRADQGDYDFDLLSRPINASLPAIALNEDPHTGNFGDGVRYDWTTAGNRVVFSAPLEPTEGRHLFSRLIDGSLPAVQLSPGGHAFVDYVVSGDGSTVALTADGFAGRGLYSRSIDGGPIRLLTGEDDNPHAFEGLYIDQHGQHVVYSTSFHLSTVPTDGSAEAKPLSPNPDGFDGRVAISPNGGRVAFLSRPDNQGPNELFISPIDGSAAAKKLSLPLPPGGNINSLQFTPDGSHIIYFGDQLTDGVDELFSVLADGSRGAVRLATSGNFRIMPDGLNVIYAAGTPAGISALYEIGIDGGQPVLLAENPYGSGIIEPWGEGWQITPDGSMLIFTADDGVSRTGIFAVAIPEPGMVCTLLGMMLLMRRRRKLV